MARRGQLSQSSKRGQRCKHNLKETDHGHSPESTGSDDTESIFGKFARAKELESELDSISTEQKSRRKPSPSSEKKFSSLRLQLCELLSDLVLTDPQVAHSQDAIGRIWKYCFYGRINEIRLRIAREKSRAKKRQASGASLGVRSTSSNGSDNIVDDLDQQLKLFLKESIALYEYLIERYTEMMLPLSQASSTASLNRQRPIQDSAEDEARDPTSSQESHEDSKHAIIVSLYRMHIHLGDLHRYSASYKQAETCYLKSARLSPGTGNPYNQLAVVAQSQDSLTAVALYCYARSLMAVYQPFETSRSNLIRLFETNYKWLAEHARNDVSVPRLLVNTRSEGTNIGKKAQKEWMQKERSASNRRFLAQLVDLQWDFFRGISIDGSTNELELEKVLSKMTSVLDTFSKLLSTAPFSDLLLCKMVAIIAFSVLGASNEGRLCNAKTLKGKKPKNPAWSEEATKMNQALVFSFAMRFTAVLARQVALNLSRKDHCKEGPAAQVPPSFPISLLSPLLLGLCFVSSLYEGSEWFHGLSFFPNCESLGDASTDNEAFLNLCKASHKEFWETVATLTNMLIGTSRELQSTSRDFAEVKDFAEFYGYVPFAPFLSKSGSNCARVPSRLSEFVSSEEVIEVISAKKSPVTSKTGEADTSAKIVLFLTSVERFTHPLTHGVQMDRDATSRYFLFKDEATGVLSCDGNHMKNSTVDQRTIHDTSLGANSAYGIVDVTVARAQPTKVTVPLLVPSDLMDIDSGGETTAHKGPILNDSKQCPAPVPRCLATTTPSAEVTRHASKHISPAADTEAFAVDLIGTSKTTKGSAKVFSRHAAESNWKGSPTVPLRPPPGFSSRPEPEISQVSAASFPAGISSGLPSYHTSVLPGTNHPPSFSIEHGEAGTGIHPYDAAIGSVDQFGLQAKPWRDPGRSTENSHLQAGTSSLSYATTQTSFLDPSSTVKTMNPFVLTPAINGNNFFQDTSASMDRTSNANKPIISPVDVTGNQRSQDITGHNGPNRTLDNALSLILGSNGIHSPDDIASSDALGQLLPAQSDDHNRNESFLKFLFEPNSSSSGSPACSRHQTSTCGFSQTKNPFVT